MVDEQLIVLEYLKILLSMLRFLKIFPAHAKKSKSFPNQPLSLNYVLFTSARIEAGGTPYNAGHFLFFLINLL